METHMRSFPKTLTTAGCLVIAGTLAGCLFDDKPKGIQPQQMADALHSVMAADRTVYTRLVVNRLQNQEKVIKASEIGRAHV